jgi:ligand-binding sensor domain-containing protein
MKPDNRVREVKRPTTVPVNVLSPIHAPVPVHGPVSAHVLLSALLLVILLLITGLSLHSQTYPFLEYTSDDGLPQTQSTSVMQDSRGYLWIPTRNGLARFDGHTFNSYLRKDGLPSNLITKVIEDKGGIIWAITANGMARFNGINFESYPFPDSCRVKQLKMVAVGRDTNSFFLSASIDYENHIILLFENGSYSDFASRHPLLQNTSFAVAATNPRDTVIYLINDDHEAFAYDRGQLISLNESNVQKITMTDGQIRYKYMSDPDFLTIEPFYWETGNLALYYEDREGTIWAGTETSIYRLMSQAFVIYEREHGLPEETWAVVADPHEGIWTGSVEGELRYFDGEKFHVRNEYQALLGQPVSFYRGSATLSNGEIWFSTREGVLIWDGKRFRVPKLCPNNYQVCIIWEDPVDKSVFVGTDRGLFHIKEDKVTIHEEMSWYGHGIVEGVARDHEGNYWLAGHHGMVYFDGKEFTPFRSEPAPVEMVWGVVCDHMGNIWSAGSDGLHICNPNNPVFDNALPEEVNLPASVIRDLGNHKLIVGRMMDICIIDLNKYYSGQPDYYSIIGRSQGFPGNDCQDNGIMQDKEGRWWILTSDKLICFDPDKISRNTHPPMNHITKVEIQGKEAPWETALEASLFYDTTSFLKIKGKQNRIRISYTGISTRNPEGVRYRYRMVGFNDNWSEKTTERSVVYSNLPPGEYLFRVQAINADGVLSEEPDQLTISIVPTFFQSKIVNAIMMMLALSLMVFLSFQIRKAVLVKRVTTARREAEAYRLQLNSVIRQFDPHFTFNAVTSVGSLIMKGEKEKAYNYFIKLSNLLRSIISDSNVLLRPLEDEIEFVTRYCELQKLRFGNRFEYTVNIDSDVNLKSPVPKMIIQSFVENAIKHGLENKKEQGILRISISNCGAGMEVIILDNGIGRAAAADLQTHGPGTGLKNIAGIVETLNKVNNEKITFTLTDLHDNGRASGTKVTVFLPYNYSLDLTADM